MKKRLWFLTSTTVILYVILNLFYISYYYNEITFKHVIAHIVVECNIILGFLLIFCKNLVSTLLDQNIFKIELILMFLIYILKKYDIMNDILMIVRLIRKIGINGIEIEMKEIEKDLESENNKINQFEGQANLNTKEEEELSNAKNKQMFLQLLVDNPNIAELVDEYVNFGYKKFRIPRNQIPMKYRLKDIQKIFLVESSGSTIKILGMKPELEETVIEVFNDLVEKRIIYSKLK